MKTIIALVLIPMFSFAEPTKQMVKCLGPEGQGVLSINGRVASGEITASGVNYQVKFSKMVNNKMGSYEFSEPQGLVTVWIPINWLWNGFGSLPKTDYALGSQLNTKVKFKYGNQNLVLDSCESIVE